MPKRKTFASNNIDEKDEKCLFTIFIYSTGFMDMDLETPSLTPPSTRDGTLVQVKDNGTTFRVLRNTLGLSKRGGFCIDKDCTFVTTLKGVESHLDSFIDSLFDSITQEFNEQDEDAFKYHEFELDFFIVDLKTDHKHKKVQNNNIWHVETEVKRNYPKFYFNFTQETTHKKTQHRCKKMFNRILKYSLTQYTESQKSKKVKK